MVDDPEQLHEIKVTYKLRTFGKRKHAEDMIERTTKLLKLNYGDAKVELKKARF